MRRMAWFVGAVVLAACQSTISDAPTLGPTDAVVTGSFALATINGQVLPVRAFLTNTEAWDLVSDTVSIVGDSTWKETSVYAVTTISTGAVTSQSSVISGKYSVLNRQINFVQTSGTASLAFAGSVHGDLLTVVFNRSQFSYIRSQ